MLIFPIFFGSLLSCTSVLCQAVQLDEEGFEIFEMNDGDSTIIMKKYFLVILKKGDKRDQSEEETAKLQTMHLAHMDSLANLGKIKLAGPFGTDEDRRGIAVYNVTSQEEAERLANADPAVVAGRLKVDVLPWWSLKGACLE